MSPHPLLPAGFERLQCFVARWAAPTLAGRDEARLASTPAERRAFYDAAGALAPAALDLLGSKPPAGLAPGERILMDLMLALVHVTLAVELQGEDEHIHARGARMMPITRGHADACSTPGGK